MRLVMAGACLEVSGCLVGAKTRLATASLVSDLCSTELCALSIYRLANIGLIMVFS